MTDYVRIRFKGGFALLARNEFDATKHELYAEPEPDPAPVPEKEPVVNDPPPRKTPAPTKPKPRGRPRK